MAVKNDARKESHIAREYVQRDADTTAEAQAESDVAPKADGPRIALSATFDEGSRAVQLSASLALLLIASTITNYSIFPNLGGVFPDAREISTYCGAAFFFVIAAVAYWRPRLLVERVWTALSFVLVITGVVFLLVGVRFSSAPFVALGAPMGGMCGAWFMVLACVSFTTLSARARAVALVSAACVNALVSAALCFADGTHFPEIPFEVAVVGYFLCYVLAYAFMRGPACSVVSAARQSEAPVDAEVTNPFSFLPLTHPVYVAILLFNIACGCALALGSSSGLSSSSPLACVPVVALFVVVVLVRRRLDADVLFSTSALLVLAGFLVVPLSLVGTGVLAGDPWGLANAFLQSGSTCFSTLTQLLMASIGARNLLAAVPLVALSQGVSWLGVGIGAMLGHAATSLANADPTLVLLVSAAFAFVFVVCSFIMLRNFSFEATIAGIRPVLPLRVHEEGAQARGAAGVLDEDGGGEGGEGAGDGVPEPAENFEERCERVAGEHGLTPRETEVFTLLAHGRTRSVIEERLVLSHNTIKTHVRSIYAKLGVHSQQELIDLVEERDEE